MHVQAATAELEIGELELVGHPRQVVATVAPTVVEYVPAVQSVHAALPVVGLYLPAAQAVHVVVVGVPHGLAHVTQHDPQIECSMHCA